MEKYQKLLNLLKSKDIESVFLGISLSIEEIPDILKCQMPEYLSNRIVFDDIYGLKYEFRGKLGIAFETITNFLKDEKLTNNMYCIRFASYIIHIMIQNYG